MKRLLTVISIVGLFALTPGIASCGSQVKAEVDQFSDANAGTVVYICTGPKAKVYHRTPRCKGLKKCSGTIEKVQKSKTNRRPCRLCAR